MRVDEEKQFIFFSLFDVLQILSPHRLLKTYASLDGGRLRALVACVKHWAKRRAVNDPYRCVKRLSLFFP